MAFDPRQVFAAFLTLSMFAMLGNMIKKDHFDSYQVKPISAVQFDVMKVEEHGNIAVSSMANKGPWMEKNHEPKPCRDRPASKDGEQSKGFITFSLTMGPEYHLSQITDAVVVARYLGATLVLPDIRGSELGMKRNFEDMYDLDKFMNSLDGVIKIVKELPAELADKKPAVVRVPNRVSEDFISKNIEPIFRSKNYLRLAIVFPSINLNKKEKQSSDLDSTACLAMFGSLELKQEIKGVAETMVDRLRTMSRKSDGKFVAIDLRVDVLEQKSCNAGESNGEKNCHNVQEISEFLKKAGFDGETTVYVTQTWWHDSLNALKDSFPRTYTKDDIIPADKKHEFLKNNELVSAVDLHICSQSDVFVPAISGLFHGNVAGKRIASGRTQILAPSSTASDFVTAYISKKDHWAYSCYC